MIRTLGPFILLMIMTGSAQADRWPLQVGWVWNYYSDYQGQTQRVEVLPETQMVRGVECIVLLKELDQITGLQRANYYLTKDLGGDVRMHGFRDLDTGSEFSFDPPILLLVQPMAMGSLWSTRSISYVGLDVGGPATSRFVETYEVTDERVFDFVFGSHHAYGLTKTFWIDPDFPAPSKAAWQPLLGDKNNEDAVIFFSEGFGVSLEFTLWLVSFERPSTPAEQSTFSALKRQFR